ncbi:MAG: Rieske (2Fe-2S) protein [Bacteroidetes bacterium]|nr:Rieske (2Fe-2S) protein [Bacteroidota bacterium]
MERRDFIKASCAFCGIAMIPGVISSCKKTPSNKSVNFTLDLTNSSNSALKSVGGSVVSNDVLVMCTAANTYAAVADACTHEGCALNYDASSKQVACPCHGGRFSTAGDVISGPPKTALQKFNVSKSGDILTITS